MKPKLTESAGADIPLKDICVEYFGMEYATAMRRARYQELPIPAYRLGDSQKGPLFVNSHDLARLSDRRYEQARKDHARMAGGPITLRASE